MELGIEKHGSYNCSQHPGSRVYFPLWCSNTCTQTRVEISDELIKKFDRTLLNKICSVHQLTKIKELGIYNCHNQCTRDNCVEQAPFLSCLGALLNHIPINLPAVTYSSPSQHQKQLHERLTICQHTLREQNAKGTKLAWRPLWHGIMYNVGDGVWLH